MLKLVRRRTYFTSNAAPHSALLVRVVDYTKIASTVIRSFDHIGADELCKSWLLEQIHSPPHVDW